MAVRRIDLLQGTLDLLILKSLGTGANHGYGIASRIHQLSQDMLRVEEGSLYPALYRLEQAGLIASDWGTSENNRRAKFYRLTRSGQIRLRKEVQQWNLFSTAVGNVLGSLPEEV